MTVHTMRRGLAAGVLGLALAQLAPGAPSAQEGARAASRPVLADTARVLPMPLSLPAVGTVVPIETVSVRPQVGGVVTRVAFTEGEDVRAGQLLFQIDPRPLQAALGAAGAQLARDQAQAANATAQAARYERLVAKDFVTREQYDAARTQADSYNAAVQADEAAVDQARLNLAYASVTSPIAGRTGQVLVKRGNVVRANDAVLVVVNQLQPIQVSFAVAGGELPAVRRHAAQGELEVHVRPARDDSTAVLSGRLVFVDNAVDPRTGTITLKAQFDNRDGALWPGQFVDTKLLLAVERDAVTVPAVAVVTGQDGPFVYVIGADGKAQRRAVKVRRTVDGTAVLDQGVAAGEVVVTDGQMWLTHGAAVQVRAAGGGSSR